MSSEKEHPIDFVSDYVTLQWLDEKRIAVFSVNSPKRQEVEAWANKAEQVILNWRTDSPYCVLHDVTKSILSPYAQKRAQKLLKLLEEKYIAGRYAVVVANNVFGQTIAAFVNFTLRPKPGALFVGKTFTSRDVALAWLREQF